MELRLSNSRVFVCVCVCMCVLGSSRVDAASFTWLDHRTRKKKLSKSGTGKSSFVRLEVSLHGVWWEMGFDFG